MPRKLPSPARLFWLVFVLGAAALSRAHDPFETTTIVQLRTGVMEVEVTMARSTALAVASGQAEAPTFEPADFPKHQAVFVAAAPGLFRITAGGRPLAMRSVQVSLGRENDVEFHLVYPAPDASPLRVEALHLARLPYGYGNVLAVRDVAKAPLGTALLTQAEPALEIALPATATPAPASAPANSAASLPVIGIAIAALAGTGWLLRRTLFK